MKPIDQRILKALPVGVILIDRNIFKDQPKERFECMIRKGEIAPLVYELPEAMDKLRSKLKSVIAWIRNEQANGNLVSMSMECYLTSDPVDLAKGKVKHGVVDSATKWILAMYSFNVRDRKAS